MEKLSLSEFKIRYEDRHTQDYCWVEAEVLEFPAAAWVIAVGIWFVAGTADAMQKKAAKTPAKGCIRIPNTEVMRVCNISVPWYRRMLYNDINLAKQIRSK